MSIHGTCFDNGQGGNCNIECSQFQAGNCDAYADVLTEEFKDLLLQDKHNLIAECDLEEVYPDFFYAETPQDRIAKFRNKIRKEVKENGN